jgi:hypothetical protein
MKYSNRFRKLIIETNATVMPRQDVLNAMLSYGDKLNVFISNYGNLSYAYGGFTKWLEENNVVFTTKKYHGDSQYFDGWIDNSNPSDLREPGDVLEVNSRNCPQNLLRNMHVYDGKLHRCSNSCFMLEMGLFPPVDRDFVDLRSQRFSTEEKRDIIRDFYRYSRVSCKYCKQKYMAILPRHPAAQQISR